MPYMQVGIAEDDRTLQERFDEDGTVGFGGVVIKSFDHEDELGDYYDRDGKRIGMEEWSEKFQDIDYKVVLRTQTPFGDVSTVWLGLNHNFRSEPPAIFETMIFGGPDEDEYQVRHSTEEAARAGHARAVKYLMPIAVNDGSKWREPSV
jgi:hypothetical protein